VDTVANKNFMGAPIVPGDLENLPPQYQYDAKTSEVSKAIGKLFNVSPMKSDYLIKSYGGVLGELGIPATTKDTTIKDTLKQKVTADPVFSNDILRNFYDKKTELDQAHAALSKQGVSTPQLNEALRKQFSSINTQVSKVRKQIKQTQSDQNLTPQQRLDKIRQLQERMNQMALQANQLAR
jgi:predicted SPOUT superfamily RNA methylase MTH1